LTFSQMLQVISPLAYHFCCFQCVTTVEPLT